MHPITEALLNWYDENARKMPWRGISDPYGIWVSEIMLQQTRVETVRDYYVRFMKRFPTLKDLAEAPEEDVLKMWEGLGYYSRARHLHRGVQQVMKEYGGIVPRDPVILRTLSGIGPYTSCSIASIAYGIAVPAVDGNVIRVICRLYGIADNPMEKPGRLQIEKLAGELVPGERAGDHNQAMMDLGATVCVPGTPDCDNCPLCRYCHAFQNGNAEELPKLPKSAPPREIIYDLPIIRSGDCILLYRRTEKLLQGLWCFPLLEGNRTERQMTEAIRRKFGISVKQAILAGEAKHVFTHQIWKMNLFLVTAPETVTAPEGYVWTPLEKMKELALPSAMRIPRKMAEDWLSDGVSDQ